MYIVVHQLRASNVQAAPCGDTPTAPKGGESLVKCGCQIPSAGGFTKLLFVHIPISLSVLAASSVSVCINTRIKTIAVHDS